MASKYLIPEPTIDDCVGTGYKGTFLYHEDGYNRDYYVLAQNSASWWAIGMVAKVGTYYHPIIVSNSKENVYTICKQGGGKSSASSEIDYNGKTFWCSGYTPWCTAFEPTNSIVPKSDTTFGSQDFRKAGIALIETYVADGGTLPEEDNPSSDSALHSSWIRRKISDVWQKTFAFAHAKTVYTDYANKKTLDTTLEEISNSIDGKANTDEIPTKVSQLTNDSNYQTDTEVETAVSDGIAKVVADAPESLDTLKEVSDWISGHEDDAAAMNSAIKKNAEDIEKKVDKVDGKGLSTNDYTTAEKNKLNGIADGANKYIHPGSGTNPHGTTKSDVGLGNVDNTADANKSVKSATKLQTYKLNSTTETYGDQYPFYAQWRDSSHLKLKCDNYIVETDYANSAGTALYLKSPNGAGVKTDEYGNLVHLRDSSTDRFNIFKNDGTTPVLQIIFKSGDTRIAGTLATAGLGTFNSGLKVSGRVNDTGDDEGIVISKASNNYAGLILGDPSGIRSVFYLKSDNSAVWKYGTGTTSDTVTEIIHPKRSGTIALTSDIPTNTNQLTNGAGFITGITKAMVTNALGYTPPTSDTNTWRGIQNNLTSTSTTDSLSANQGKVLKGLIDGKVELSADGVSKAINQLTIGTSDPTDNDYYVAQYAGGGTTTTTYHRRSVSALWNYIKSKTDKVYLPLSGGTMTGTLVSNGKSGSYNENIRLHPSSTNWTSIVMCGDDNTGASGTSAKTWGIFTYNGNFSIAKNGTALNSSSSANLTCDTNNVWKANGETLITSAGGTISGTLKVSRLATPKIHGSSNQEACIKITSYNSTQGEHYPSTTGVWSCGVSANKWYAVWSLAYNGASDRKLKMNIEPIDVNFADKFIDGLKPSSYKFKDNMYGKTHTGFIAQDVEQTLLDMGLQRTDFAGLVKVRKKTDEEKSQCKSFEEINYDPDNYEGDDENYDYSLRYDDFIAPIVTYIQNLKRTIVSQNDKIINLQSRLEKIENTINV